MWEAAARRDAVLPRARRFPRQFLLPQAVRKSAWPSPYRPVPGPKKAWPHCEREARAKHGFSTRRRRVTTAPPGTEASRARRVPGAQALVQAHDFWFDRLLLRLLPQV